MKYLYFKEYYKLVAIDWSKQQTVDVISKPTQQIDFTWNLGRTEGATLYFIIEEVKETILDILYFKPS